MDGGIPKLMALPWGGGEEKFGHVGGMS